MGWKPSSKAWYKPANVVSSFSRTFFPCKDLEAAKRVIWAIIGDTWTVPLEPLKWGPRLMNERISSSINET